MNTPVYPRVPLGVLAEHTAVRVRSWLDGSWAAGFEIAGIVAEDNDILGYRVRRVSNGTLLGAWVSPDDVMPVRRVWT
jgi:hypothetical protein